MEGGGGANNGGGGGTPETNKNKTNTEHQNDGACDCCIHDR